MLRGPDAQRIYAGQRTSTVCQPAKSSVLLTGLSKPSPAPRGTEACKVGRERAALSRAKDRCLCAASQQDVQVAQCSVQQQHGSSSDGDSINQQPLGSHSYIAASVQLTADDTRAHKLVDRSCGSGASAAAGRPQAMSGLLQQAATAAAVSALAVSVCLTSPTAALAQPLLQQGSQLVQQYPQQQSSGRVHSFDLSPSTQWLLRQQESQHVVAVDLQKASSRAAAAVAADNAAQPSEHEQQLMFSLSSQVEDGMLEAARQMEAGFDRAFGAISSRVHMIDAAQASSEQAAFDVTAQALIREVWEVVDNSYMDARNSGFNHDKWLQLRDAALARTYYDQASVHRAVKDMLAQGVSDPYCRFIPPAEFQSMKKYDVTGVGLNLGTAEEYIKKTGRPLPTGSSNDGGVWVVGLSKGSEADSAGIEQGDQLLQVANMELSSVTPFQAATLIAGPDDSSAESLVNLKVQKTDGQVMDVAVQRPPRYLPSPVSSSLQERSGGRLVGFIRLTSFNARALRDVSTALAELQQRGATELVLDLRDNRGGLVSEGLEVARLFLADKVPIVLTQSKAMAADPPKAGLTATTQLPLTVLVNEHTASASEILAGALKDNCRGVLVGKRTYGKGLIQSVYELSDSSGLVITVGKYLTPRGVDIDRFGIAPDFGSLPAPDQAADTLNACRLEAGLAPSPAEAMVSASSRV